MILLDMDPIEVKRLLETVIEGAVAYDENYLGTYVCEYCGVEANKPNELVHYKGKLEPKCIVYTAKEMLEQLEQQDQFNNLTLNIIKPNPEEVRDEVKNN